MTKKLNINLLDEAKTAHMHKTPQMEQITKLHQDNTDIREKLLMMEAENNVLRAKLLEAQERLIDYRKFIKSLNALEAIESWFDDDSDED